MNLIEDAFKEVIKRRTARFNEDPLVGKSHFKWK